MEPEDIRSVVEGQVEFDDQLQARLVAMGGKGMRTGYAIYTFTLDPKAELPKTMRFRKLLVRKPHRGENRDDWIDAVLKNRPAWRWQLCEFEPPIKPYVCEQIPEEIYDSPNLPFKRELLPALRSILDAYEAGGQADLAIELTNVTVHHPP